MKLFTLGPVEMFPYTLEKGKEQVPYFRTNEFSEVVWETDKLLKKSLYCNEEDKVLLLTASGTGAMEAVVMNCLNRSDQVLVIDGGSFGHRFVELCELHEIPHEVIKLDFGQELTKERLEPYQNKGFSALLVNIHETSTGQLYDIKLLAEFCKNNSMYFIIDAISSFLADKISVRDYGIDAIILSSQKGLALAPGLSIVVLSERLITERVQKNIIRNMYFDFRPALKNAERGQTPFTPAVGIIYQLYERLQHIDMEGVENVIESTREIAVDFRKRLQGLPLSLPPYPMSNAATPLIISHAYDVYSKLRNEFGITVTPNGGALADRVIRVGHIGYHAISDNILLVQALEQILC